MSICPSKAIGRHKTMKQIALATIAALISSPALADLSCAFDKYCETGKRCRANSFELTVRKTPEPHFEWRGPTRKAIQVHSQTRSSYVFVSASSGFEVSEIWALSVKSGTAALSLTTAVSQAAEVATYLGTCTGEWE